MDFPSNPLRVDVLGFLLVNWCFVNRKATLSSGFSAGWEVKRLTLPCLWYSFVIQYMSVAHSYAWSADGTLQIKSLNNVSFDIHVFKIWFFDRRCSIHMFNMLSWYVLTSFFGGLVFTHFELSGMLSWKPCKRSPGIRKMICHPCNRHSEHWAYPK